MLLRFLLRRGPRNSSLLTSTLKLISFWVSLRMTTNFSAGSYSTVTSGYVSDDMVGESRIRVHYRSHLGILRRTIVIPTSYEYDSDDELINAMAIVYKKEKRLPRKIVIKRNNRSDVKLHIPRNMWRSIRNLNLLDDYPLTEREEQFIRTRFSFILSGTTWWRLYAILASIVIVATLIFIILAFAL